MAPRRQPEFYGKDFESFRFNGIGGSDAAVIMGVSPHKTKYQLWEEKIFRTSKTYDNPAMAQGRRLEEPVRQFLSKEFGIELKPSALISPEHSWLRGNLDGIDDNGKIVIEIKNPTNRDGHDLCLKKKIPDIYYPQVQHYLELVRHVGYDIPTLHYASHCKSDLADPEISAKDVYIVHVDRDDAYIMELMEKEEEFWDGVVNWKPPALTDRDRIEMAKICQTPAERLSVVLETLDKLEEEKDLLKTELIQLNGGQSCEGFGLMLYRTVSRGNVDWQRLCKENPDLNSERYRKSPLTKWTVRRI